MKNKKKKTYPGQGRRIVCLGGGTGTFTVLSGLKKYPVDLTAIVSMADSGGCNRVIRDEFGLLPLSDIRQCFVALAQDSNNSEHILRNLFTYRFRKGSGIKGMTFGNLFMAALADIGGSEAEAIKQTGQILKIKGKVLPVTLGKTNLGAVYEDGRTVIGEHFIDEPSGDGRLMIKKVFLQPPVGACSDAIKAILGADLIVIGPGDLYTSLIVNSLVAGIREALEMTKAKIVYVLNLMTKYGQTYGFSAKNHIKALEEYFGENCLDFVLVNSGFIPGLAARSYKKNNEAPVVDDLGNSYFKVIKKDLLSKKETKKVSGDVLKRSLIRHDSDKLAKIIMRISRM